jgi:ubiquinone biosynthesis protein Coq4
MYDKNHNFPLDDNEKPLDNSGNSLQYKNDYFIEVGFIAQDVRNITEFAEFVNGEEYEEKIIQEFEKDPSGEPILDESGNIIVINTSKKQVPTKLSLNYNNLFCYHIQATQELHKAQQADKAEIAELKNELKEMKTMLNALKSHLGL